MENVKHLWIIDMLRKTFRRKKIDTVYKWSRVEVGYWWSGRWRRIWNVEESGKNDARRISTVGLERENLLSNEPYRFDLHLLTGISKVYVGFTQSSQFSMSSPKTSICSVVSKISYLAWIFTVASRNTSSVSVFGSGKGRERRQKRLFSINQ